jgi:hypothetical protein
MIRASRRRLPPWEPQKPSWVLFAIFLVATIVFWALHIAAAAYIFGAVTTLFVIGLPLRRRELDRRRAVLSSLPPDATCTFARSFDFRHTDTTVMRAVYDKLQPLVSPPIQASHRLIEDLQLDDEDLSFGRA